MQQTLPRLTLPLVSCPSIKVPFSPLEVDLLSLLSHTYLAEEKSAQEQIFLHYETSIAHRGVEKC
jgi:hypothetical protein